MSRLFNYKETDYMRRQFQETLDTHGIHARIYPIGKDHNKSYDFYNDIVNTESFGDAIDIKITYETVPSIKTLQNLGWYVKDEALPYLAYIPTTYVDTKDKETKTLTPTVDDLIELFPNPMDKVMLSRKYLIKDFVSQGYPNTIYYLCKLVPYRQNLEDKNIGQTNPADENSNKDDGNGSDFYGH